MAIHINTKMEVALPLRTFGRGLRAKKLMKRKLKEGFTTGSAASAAARAALISLLTGSEPSEVMVPLPPFTTDNNAFIHPRSWMRIQIQKENSPKSYERSCQAYASVRKEAGDDPDITHGALITATLGLTPNSLPLNSHVLSRLHPVHVSTYLMQEAEKKISLAGGSGIGRITLPGLPLPVGEWAINPVPRQQIRYALVELLLRCTDVLPQLSVTLSVQNGEILAQKTLNPRLGILGGISILGTHGIVKPYSNEAFTGTIAEALSVALALKLPRIYLATGRRSERLLSERFNAPPQAFIQVADQVFFALTRARELGFASISFGCFIGKLVKIALGETKIHARESSLSLEALAELCLDLNLACADSVRSCLTAAAALEYILNDPAGKAVLSELVRRARLHLIQAAAHPVDLYLFHTNGRLLATGCGPG